MTYIKDALYGNKLFKKALKSLGVKWIYRLSCNNYRGATLSKLYQTDSGIIMQSFNSIGLF